MAYIPDSPVDWNYTTTSGHSTQCHENKVYKASRGKMLGGTSSMNYMGYLRGDPEDFNTWARITKNPTWNYENVLPYFIKSEKLEDNEILHSETGYFHGTRGPLGVTRSTHAESIPYLQSFHEIGHNIRVDMNGNHTLGYGELLYTKSHGVRQSAGQAFLSPIINRKNLYVLKRALVTKIIFDERKNAIGVKVIDNNNKNLTFKANMEIIVSAGAINSPQLLMLSGIGRKKHLNKLQIPVLSDLPVGENLQDHIAVALIQTLTVNSGPSKPQNPHDIPVPIINGFVSLDNEPYPQYQTLNLVLNAELVTQFCANAFAYSYDMCQKIYEKSEAKQVLYTSLYDLKPQSRGTISLRSRDPKQSPVIDLDAFSKSVDINNTIRFIKDFLKVENSSFFKRANAELFVPDCVKELPVDSDCYWREFSLCMSTSMFHYGSTCAMGLVLDSRLRVLGVNKLRVVDASSMPTLPRANPNPAIIMLAEKAADMIKYDNGIDSPMMTGYKN